MTFVNHNNHFISGIKQISSPFYLQKKFRELDQLTKEQKQEIEKIKAALKKKNSESEASQQKVCIRRWYCRITIRRHPQRLHIHFYAVGDVG